MNLLKAALAYRRWGLNVIPLTGRTPRFEWKERKSIPLSNDEFDGAFKQGGLTGIAVILGCTSNDVYVRDFDIAASFKAWQTAHSDFAKALPISSTPNSGFHVFGRSKSVSTVNLGDGELRGEGALANLPPSMVDGKLYKWENPMYSGDLIECDPYEIGLSKAWTTTIQPLYANLAVKGRKDAHVEICTIEDVIAVSLPIQARTNDKMALVFAQAVRSLEKHLGCILSEDELIKAIKKWFEGASQRKFTRDPYECYEDKFLRACRNVKYPLGYNPLTPAFEIASVTVPPKVAMEKDLSQPATALATFFREAQRIAGAANTFFVSYSDISRFYPSFRAMDTKNIWAIVNTLERRGIIKRESRGKVRSKECPKGKAAAYRYLYPLDDS